MNKKHKFLLVGLLSFFFFFSFFQTSHAGFFDWFKLFDWFKKSNTQSAPLDNPAVKQYTLLISKIGSGSLTSDDGKINCGNNDGCGKIYTYPAGSKVVLIGKPDSEYVLDKWEGCDSTNSGKCEITINKSKTVVAKFILKASGLTNAPQKRYSSSKFSAASSKTYSSKVFSSVSPSKNSSSKSNSQSSSSSSYSREYKNNFYIIKGEDIETSTFNDDIRAISKKFYREHPDNYDFLVIISGFLVSKDNGQTTRVDQQFITVKNDTKGIGERSI